MTLRRADPNLWPIYPMCSLVLYLFFYIPLSGVIQLRPTQRQRGYFLSTHLHTPRTPDDYPLFFEQRLIIHENSPSTPLKNVAAAFFVLFAEDVAFSFVLMSQRLSLPWQQRSI
jgi:hypothetical protein